MKVKDGVIVLDKLDWQLLRILQKNARQTYSEVGRQLGVAHSTVYDHIKRLEECGVIQKYAAVINLDKIGVKNVTAIMTIFTDPKESDAVATKLSALKQVYEVSNSLSEELIIIAKVVAENQEKLHSFIAQTIAPLPGVLRIKTSIITRKFKNEIPLIQGGEVLP